MKNRILRSLVWMALALAAVAPLAWAQGQVAGDWQGNLVTGTTTLRLVVHITASPEGVLSATIDSIDQHSMGIPISTIGFQDGKLSLKLDKPEASYEGVLNPQATVITGTWTQGSPLALDFKRVVRQDAAVPVGSSDIDGKWAGPLNLGAAQLHLTIRIVNTQDGLKVSLESSDQNAAVIPATRVIRNGKQLALEFKSIGATFLGDIAADLLSIEGIFKQGQDPEHLVLKRVTDSAQLERHRPQNPVKPYPYKEEEVTFTNTAAGATLAGTLTIPAGKGPFPAVLLIAGSGPRDRDETLLGHKPFLVLSDYLTRKGIVVLRADKRGIGKSTGEYATATTADFAADAAVGVEFLKGRPEVDGKLIGLVGHSEGGLVAPLVASTSKDVAYIVLLAANGLPGDQVVIEQTRLAAEANGMDAEEVAKSTEREKKLLAIVAKDTDNEQLEKDLRDELAGNVPIAQINPQIRALTSPWFRYFMNYDPAVTLRKVSCPVLALNGEKDKQVPAKLNLPAVRKALEEGGNKHVEADELPGLNHLFQTAKTGAPAEYAEIEETMSPAALGKISSWILMQ